MQQLLYRQTYVHLTKTGQSISLFSRASIHQEDSVQNTFPGTVQGIIRDDFEKGKKVVSRNEEIYSLSDTSGEILKTRNMSPCVDEGPIPSFFTILTSGSLDFVWYSASVININAHCCRPRARLFPSKEPLC